MLAFDLVSEEVKFQLAYKMYNMYSVDSHKFTSLPVHSTTVQCMNTKY